MSLIEHIPAWSCPAALVTSTGVVTMIFTACSLAGMNPEDIDRVDEIGFFGNLPVFSAYTEYDKKKLMAILKKLKMKPRDGVGDGSHEADYVNTESPVKPFRGYAR
jgi:hypothetical protein